MADPRQLGGGSVAGPLPIAGGSRRRRAEGVNSQEEAGMASSGRYQLQSVLLGPLPLVNHFLSRMRLADSLERFVPADDPRVPEMTSGSCR
ncbi:MAG: hypothetical protein ACYDAQ_20490 [Mycobacteriales bacterium]